MDFGALPVSVVRLVDRACDEFETAWRAGRCPQIEDYLANQPEPARAALLQGLLALELEARIERGEQPAPEDYLARFPADADLIRSTVGAAARTETMPPLPAHHENVPEGSITRGIPSSLAAANRPGAKWIWAWPLLAAAILAVAGYWASTTIEQVMRAQVASELLALRDADVEALSGFFGAQQAVASIAASDPQIVASTRTLLALHEPDTATLLKSPELAKLRAVLATWLGKYEYDGFRILTRRGRTIASWRDRTVGGLAGKEEIECLSAVFEGRATVSRPRPSEVPLPDVDGKERLSLPTMFVLAPIRDDTGRVIAALGFRMRPERTFTRVLNVARFGRTGETFAFDPAGLLLSESRFDDDLKHVGLITDAPGVRSTLSLELRDPGVNMTRGARPKRAARRAAAHPAGHRGHAGSGRRGRRRRS